MTVPPPVPQDEGGRRPENEGAGPDHADGADGHAGSHAGSHAVVPASSTDTSGAHRAERPVPRAGLSEQHSASHLSSERGSPAQSDPYTTITPADEDADGAGGRAAGRDTPGERSRSDHTDGADRADRHGHDEPDTAVILDGASVEPAPRKRTAAHLWGILLTLVLIPVAWYLIADAGARLTLAEGNQWETGTRNVAALIELGGGLLALALALLVARWTSLGAIIAGSLVLLLGLPFVAIPTMTQEYLEPVTDWLRDSGDFGSNLAHHLVASGASGRLVAYGLALILVGVVSHGARRQGRREGRAGGRLERHHADDRR